MRQLVPETGCRNAEWIGCAESAACAKGRNASVKRETVVPRPSFFDANREFPEFVDAGHSFAHRSGHRLLC